MPHRYDPQVARFLFYNDDIASGKGIARPRAFLPRDPRDGATSVAETTGCEAVELQELSKTVSNLRGRDARGHATILLENLPSTGLRFVRDDNPFERHGNLVGWPDVLGPLEKAARKSIAQKLSSMATLVEYE